MSVQADLFPLPAPPGLPAGFRYASELIEAAEEAALASGIARLPFKPFEFHGFLGNRRTVSFGLRYDFGREALEAAEAPPQFLLPLRAKAASLAGLAEEAFAHALVTEYAPGAGIGWHRDKPQFGVVVGVSLLAPCTFRFRRREGAGWRRASLTLEPRSAYVLEGEARHSWQHSIPPMEALRYSVTFRTMA
jgi:alkylated DNA repair dioxygenase AlkB